MTETTTTPPRTATVHHRADYRLPDHLIDTVDLRFDLHEDRVDVKALLAVRRNPASRSSWMVSSWSCSRSPSTASA